MVAFALPLTSFQISNSCSLFTLQAQRKVPQLPHKFCMVCYYVFFWWEFPPLKKQKIMYIMCSKLTFTWASWARNGSFEVFFEKNGHGPLGVKPSILVVSWQLDIWGTIRGRRRPGPPRPWPHHPSPRPPKRPPALAVPSCASHFRFVAIACTHSALALASGSGTEASQRINRHIWWWKQETFLPAYGPCFLALYVCTPASYWQTRRSWALCIECDEAVAT
jgi:hypothetical protein